MMESPSAWLLREAHLLLEPPLFLWHWQRSRKSRDLREPPLLREASERQALSKLRRARTPWHVLRAGLTEREPQ